MYATIGCIEVMGPSAFVAFDLLLKLSGAPGATWDDRLHALARAGQLWIRYEAAQRPALIRAS